MLCGVSGSWLSGVTSGCWLSGVSGSWFNGASSGLLCCVVSVVVG